MSNRLDSLRHFGAACDVVASRREAVARRVRSGRWCVAALVLMAGMTAHAEIPSWNTEYGNRLKYGEMVKPLEGELFGEQINLYDGSLSFATTDISLPGNSEIPLSVGRTLNPTDPKSNLPFGDWELDIPSISGLFGGDAATVAAGYWAPAQRCSTVGPPPAVTIKNRLGTYNMTLSNYEYWDGTRLSAPGGEGGELLGAPGDAKQPRPNVSVATPWNTKNGWFFSCLPNLKSGQAGEGFLGHSPDGMKYYFDWMVVRDYQADATIQPYDAVSYTRLPRNKVFLYPSQVMDRFGNWVRYEWEGSKLNRIYASDGRSISLTWDTGGRISAITAGTRQWTYQYGAYNRLISATQPDGRVWSYDIPPPSILYKRPVNDTEPESNYKDYMGLCAKMSKIIDVEATYNIIHPSGVMGTFRLHPIRHGRYGIRFDCVENGVDGTIANGWNRTPMYRDAFTLTSKTISGPGVTTAQWLYAYQNLGGRYNVDVNSANWDPYPVGSAEHKFTVETGPDGTEKTYEYGKEAGYNDGKLLGVVTRKAGAVVKTEATTYYPVSNLASAPFPQNAGISFVYGTEEILTYQNQPVQKTTLSQDGVQFSQETTAFDAYARGTGSVESNSLGESRASTQEFYDDLALWRVGQSKRSTVAGIENVRVEYDAANALPVRFYQFGRLTQTVGYASDGTVASVADGRGNASQLSNWKFGIPQQLRFPATPEAPGGAVRSVVVDDNGWITSLTDENGYASTYGYDAMGRLNSMQFPSGDSVAWNGITYSLAPLTTAVKGVPVGGWLHTRTHGAHVTETYMDALFRPVLVNELANGQPVSAVVTRYDVSGHKVFTSYPVQQVTSISQQLTGVATEYDALERPVKVIQHSELGPLVTTTEYIGGLSTRMTNPRGLATTTRFRSYGQPKYEQAIAITQPENVVTEIERDALGSPTAITRHSADNTHSLTRRYVYDANHLLCKTIEPETGATVSAYDAAGNLAWSAAGTTLTGTTTCDTTSAQSSGRAVTRTYDARNRLTALRFPDGRGNQDWTYTPDSLPASVTTTNDTSVLPVVNSYQYNRRRLLTQESQQHAVLGARTLAYAYDANGALGSITYPSGRAVAFAPDALGRPTQAGTYATGVTYYPNGGMSRFVYGNGIVHTMVQNARGLPDRSTDLAGATPVLDDGYDYDAVGNVMAISDGVPSGTGNRDMTYDGLDRLKTVQSAAFGAAAYTYDALDNLRSAKVGVRDRSHVFDATNRLTNIMDVGTGATVTGLSYDVQGNLANRNGTLFDFDYGNRLRSVQGTESYQYDAQGRRVASVSTSAGAIYSLYDNSGVLRAQRNERTGKEIEYIHLNGSLVAKTTENLKPTVPVLTAPAYLNQGAFTVSWTAVGAATRYELQEAVGTAAYAGIYSGAALSTVISGKGTGNYQYRVRACRDNCGNWSNVAAVSIALPPAQAPTLTVPQYGDNGAYSVSWTSVAGAERYELEQNSSGTWAQVYNAAALSWSITGRAAGSYSYRVRACNSIGCAGYSATGTVLVTYPPASAPTLSAPARATLAGWAVNWTTVAGATYYRLQESANGGSSWTTLADNVGTSASFGNRPAGDYYYRVAACNRAGCSTVWSATAKVTAVAPPTLAPTLSAPTLVSTTSYTVTWATPAGTETVILQESANGGAWTEVYTGGGTSFVANRSDGSYAYRALACNFGGCSSSYSGVVTVVVVLPPATPAIELANWLTTKTAPYRVWCEVGWSAVAKATEYQVQSGGGASVYTGPKTYVAANGNAYCKADYKVRACNGVGCSAWSTPNYPVTQGVLEQ
ncbi:MAG TPA: wall-associated protein [Stenotrophomonas sp.]|nr:wall-associated protein [Stenotrophomonas sp.]